MTDPRGLAMAMADAEARLAGVRAGYQREIDAAQARIRELEAERDRLLQAIRLHREYVANPKITLAHLRDLISASGEAALAAKEG